MAVIINAQTKLTYEDYVLFPENGKIHEIIDGEHYMTPAPGTYHQTLSRRIQFQLYEQIEKKGLGVVFNAPTDIQFSQIDIVQPDLIVILAARESIISPSRVIGPPDLVVEILSKTTAEKDQKLKFDLYQKAGVPEYWLVDPESQKVRKYLLKKGRYKDAGEEHDEVHFEGLKNIRVNLLEVW